MTGHALPQRLWRPLAEVKNFMEKQPECVTLTNVSLKVKTFGKLSKNDKSMLIGHLDSRHLMHVFQARPENGKNLTTFFLHRKFDLPKSINGYQPPVQNQKLKIIPSDELIPQEDKQEHPALLEHVCEDEISQKIPSEEASKPTETIENLHDDLIEENEEEYAGNSVHYVPMDAKNKPNKKHKNKKVSNSHSESANQEKLNEHLSSDIRLKIDNFISRLNKANDDVQTTLDTLYDQMGEIDKIALEFKSFSSTI